MHDSVPSLLSGVSAFAFQGTNAHAILQQPIAAINASRLAMHAWHKSHHWVAPQPHFMLQNGTRSSRSHITVDTRLSQTPALSFFWDHRVSDKVLFPGAGFLELAVATAKLTCTKQDGQLALADASIPSPLQLANVQAEQPAIVELRCTINLINGDLAVVSSPTGYKQPHIAGQAVWVDAGVDAEPIQGRTNSVLSKLLSNKQYASNEMQPAAFANVDNSCRDDTSYVHPASLDSCLQLAAACAPSFGLKIPAGMSALLMIEKLTSPALWAASMEAASDASKSVVDYSLSEGASHAGLSLQSLTMKSVKLSAAAQVSTSNSSMASPEKLLYEIEWLVDSALEHSAWCMQPIAGNPSIRLPGSMGSVNLTARAMQALQTAQLQKASAVQLSTMQAVSAVVPAPQRFAAGTEHGALPGLLRTVALEYPGQQFDSIDFDKLSVDGITPNLSISNQPCQGQPRGGAYGMALRAGTVHLASLSSSRSESAHPAFRLFPQPRGAIGNLVPQPVPLDAVAPGDIVLAVKAVGVNFRCGQAVCKKDNFHVN